jgi:hypothetical protein
MDLSYKNAVELLAKANLVSGIVVAPLTDETTRGFQHNECHSNALAWVRANGGEVVQGWLVSSGVYDWHSVVLLANNYHEVTVGQEVRFVPHKAVAAQPVDRPLPGLAAGIRSLH